MEVENVPISIEKGRQRKASVQVDHITKPKLTTAEEREIQKQIDHENFQKKCIFWAQVIAGTGLITIAGYVAYRYLSAKTSTISTAQIMENVSDAAFV